MITINLFGGPGAGKSTTAAGLFFLMKNAGMKVELVTEYAKDMVWAGRHKELDDQLYILAKQHHRLHVLREKVDYVITDSPLLLSSIYAKEYALDMPNSFHELVANLFLRYENRSVVITRTKPYHEYGRNQTEDEAKALDNRIASMLFSMGEMQKCLHVMGDSDAPHIIFSWLTRSNP